MSVLVLDVFWVKYLYTLIAVSYTHLDVYKRQVHMLRIC